MKLYSKYIFLRLTKLFLINILVLIFVALSVKVLSLLNINMISGTKTLITAIKIAIISIPALLLYLSPISLLCTILYIYYSMHIDRETTVLESSGLSKSTIAKPALNFAIFVTLVCYSLTFFGIPASKRKLNYYIDFMKNNIELSSAIEEKTFTRISKHMTLYVNSKHPHNAFEGVTLYNKESNKSTTFILAKKAKLVDHNNKLFFQFFNGNRQSLNNENLQILYFKELKFDVPKTSLLKPSSKNNDLEEQYITHLITKNGNLLKNSDALSELHQRLIWPILNLAIACIAISASFSTEFKRKFTANQISYASLSSIFLFGTVILSSRKASTDLVFAALTYLIPIATCIISLHLLESYSTNQKPYLLNVRNILNKKKNSKV